MGDRQRHLARLRHLAHVVHGGHELPGERRRQFLPVMQALG